MFKDNYSVKTNLKRLFMQRYERYLPTAFDESMSILEKMNKLIQSHNAIIDVVNTHVEFTSDQLERAFGIIDENIAKQLKQFRDELEEQKTLYEELRDQMYGDLLPDTVKQKLEEWLLNGTIRELIEDTVFYEWVERLQTAENEIDDIEDVLDGYKSVLAYEDDVVNGDWTPAFRKAFEQLGKGETFKLPDREFTLKTPLYLEGTGKFDLYQGLKIKGHKNTILKIEHEGIGLDIYDCQRLEIENVRIIGKTSYKERASSIALRMVKVTHLTMPTVQISFFNTGVLLDGNKNALYCSIYDPMIYGCKIGIKTQNSANEFNVYNGRITQNETGIHLEDVNGGAIHGVCLEGSAVSVNVVKSSRIKIDSTRFENPYTFFPDLEHYGIRIDETSHHIDVININSTSNLEDVYIHPNNKRKDTINVGMVGMNNLFKEVRKVGSGNFATPLNHVINPLFDEWDSDTGLPVGSYIPTSNPGVIVQKVPALFKGTNALRMTTNTNNSRIAIRMIEKRRSSGVLHIVYKSSAFSRVVVQQTTKPTPVLNEVLEPGFHVKTFEVDGFDNSASAHRGASISIHPDATLRGGDITIDSLIWVDKGMENHGFYSDDAEKINVKMFGINGDGTDESEKFLKLIGFFGNNVDSPGYTIKFNKGDYNIGNPPNLNKKVIIEGMGYDTKLPNRLFNSVVRDININGGLVNDNLISVSGTQYIIRLTFDGDLYAEEF